MKTNSWTTAGQAKDSEILISTHNICFYGEMKKKSKHIVLFQENRIWHLDSEGLKLWATSYVIIEENLFI